MAVLAVLSTVRAAVLHQLATIFAPLLLVRLLLPEIALQLRAVSGELRLVRCDRGLVVCRAIFGELLVVVDHLLMIGLYLAPVGLHSLAVVLELGPIRGDLLVSGIAVIGARPGR